MNTSGKTKKTKRGLEWYHWLVVVLSALLTLSAWNITSNQAEERLLSEFHYQSEQTIRILQERMEKYEEALWAGTALIKSYDGDINRKIWRKFSSSLKIQERFPGINGIGVIYNVEPERLEDFISNEKNFYKNFKVYPDHNIADYWPITYIEPEEVNRQAIGLDMAHEANRYSAALEAKRSGDSVITGPITLVQDSNKTPGFLFFAPWYNDYLHGFDSGGYEFGGLVYAPFIMNKLMVGALENKNRKVLVEIFDNGIELYSDAEFIGGGDIFYNKEVYFYGRKWLFSFEPTPDFLKAYETSQPLIILIGGVLIDLLLFYLFLLMSYVNYEANRKVEMVSVDLDDRKRKLRKIQGVFHAAMSAIRDGLIITNSSGDVLDCNPEASFLFRGEFEDINGVNVKDFKMMKSISLNLSDDKYSELNVDDRFLVLKVSKFSVGDEEYFALLISDVTDMKVKDKDLNRLNSILGASVKSSYVGFGILDGNNKFTTSNEAMAEFLGESESLYGISMKKYIPEDQWSYVEERLCAVLSGDVGHVVFEQKLTRGCLSDFWVMFVVSSVPNVDENQRSIVVQVVDINRQKELEMRLEDKNRDLIEVNKDLDQFAFIASHDLKSPLRGITQLSQWIEDDLKEVIEESTQEYLNIMRGRISRLERLLDDLLSYSRIGRKDGEISSVNIKEMVEGNFLIARGDRKSNLDFLSEGPEVIETLITPLEIIIRNLIGNAIKHSDKEIALIIVGFGESDDFYRFSIKDNGPGIPKEHHGRVFDLFSTLRPRDDVEGSGMGLAIINKILDRYQGSYDLISNEGYGTEFIFFWPKSIKE